MGPGTIPIFPLPSVVLFPNVFLPLHIFHYREARLMEGGRPFYAATLVAARQSLIPG